MGTEDIVLLELTSRCYIERAIVMVCGRRSASLTWRVDGHGP